MPGVANPLHFGNDSGVTSPLKPAPKKLPLPNAAVPPDSANPLRAEDNSGVTIPVWRPSPKKPPAPAAAAMAQARCRTRLFFAAGLLLGALLGAVSVGSFLPRLLDVVTIRGEPLPFPLPLFFRNLTPPERGSWSYTRYPDDGKGPGTWGTLRDPASGALRYPLCADRSQSPIALSAAGATPRGTGTQLHRTAKGARNFTMTPRAEYEGWEFTLRDGAAPPKWLVDGDVYEFQEFHYHSPSEHTLEGVQHALELHFLFELPGPEEPPQRAVMAILFPWASNNPDNPFVSSFWNNICACGRKGGGGRGWESARGTPKAPSIHPVLRAPHAPPRRLSRAARRDERGGPRGHDGRRAAVHVPLQRRPHYPALHARQVVCGDRHAGHQHAGVGRVRGVQRVGGKRAAVAAAQWEDGGAVRAGEPHFGAHHIMF